MEILKMLQEIKIFGNPLVDLDDLFELVILLVINTGVALVIVRGIYYPLRKEKNYAYAFILSNIAIFLVCYMLINLKQVQLGFAFGLFAVLSIVRYRTEAIPIKEMTYFFIIIVIAVINALSSKAVSYSELVFVNLVFIGMIYYLEHFWMKKQTGSKFVVYEKIDLIKPNKREELVSDLKERTGYNVIAVKVGRINYLNDTALVEIFYKEHVE